MGAHGLGSRAFFFFQAEDGIRDYKVTGVQTCALPISFFSVTGLHLLHVIVGVIVIGVIALGYRRGRFDPGHLEAIGLYWHFVDLVWMFVFPLVYLMNLR